MSGLTIRKSEWEFIKTLVTAVFLAMVFRSFLFEPFHIPSGSMKSNLLIGDYLFVNKFAYGYSRYSFPFGLKILNTRSSGKHLPERGDVVVFRPPGDMDKDFIKRIMGLPGDRIQVSHSVVYINGKEVPRIKKDDWQDEDTGHLLDRFQETLPEGKKILVLDEVPNGPADNTIEYVVPEGHYFMMGDNRDNSEDSRYPQPVGFVPLENIVGKAVLIMVSFHDITTPRWNRFFTRIE